MKTDDHTFRIYDAKGKTLALVEVPYDPSVDEMVDVLEFVGEFYQDMTGYEHIGPSNKKRW